MIFLDSNIVIDLLDDTGDWPAWSKSRIARLRSNHAVVVNAVVLAETAGRFDNVDTQSRFFCDLQAEVQDMDCRAAYRAGLAYRAYRKAGGPRAAVLADFLIGGHAVVLGATLLTRDRGRFASYFPELNLITPETHS